MSSITAGDARPTSADTDILGHPRGLVILFFTEMWERFSYYGMRALLVLYLVQHFLMDDKSATGVYAAFGSLVYLLPIIGGMVADRYLGARKAVIIGAILLVAGHFTMALEGSGGRQYLTLGDKQVAVETVGRDENRQLFAVTSAGRAPIEVTPAGVRTLEPHPELPAFTPTGEYVSTKVKDARGEMILYLALSLIIVGVGFLKANISAVVGQLYGKDDPRQDAGFTIYYMGINLGSLLATLSCGWFGIKFGWAYGFGLAGIGMLFGLLVFVLGQSWLEGKAAPPDEARLKRKILGVPFEAWLYIVGSLAVLPVAVSLQHSEVINAVGKILYPLIFAGVLLWVGLTLKGVERGRMAALILLTVFGVVFWTLFEQAGSSMTNFADRSTRLGGATAAMITAFNPFFIFVGGPIFIWLWSRLSKRGLEPSTPSKFAYGIIQAGLGFLVLVYAINFHADDNYRVALFWLGLAYFLHSTGELCLSPTGLSMVSRLSLPKVVGLMYGVWFLSWALAILLAGQVATLTASETVGGVVVDPKAQLASFSDTFNTIGWAGVIIGLFLLFVAGPLIKKMMAGVR